MGFGKLRNIAEKTTPTCSVFAYTANLHISFLHMIHEVNIAFT